MIFLQNMSWHGTYGFVPKSYKLIRTWPAESLRLPLCYPHFTKKYNYILHDSVCIYNWTIVKLTILPLEQISNTHTQFMIHLKFSGYAWFIQSYSHDILHGFTALKGGVIISPFPVRWENLAFLFHKTFIYLLFLPSFKCLPSLWFLSQESEWDLECKERPSPQRTWASVSSDSSMKNLWFLQLLSRPSTQNRLPDLQQRQIDSQWWNRFDWASHTRMDKKLHLITICTP